MTMPAARLFDMHMCVAPAPPPATPLPPPGVPNTIDIIGASTVLIGNIPAARVSDQSLKGVPHPIVKGSMTVLVGNLPAARAGDMTAHPACVAPIPSPTGTIIPPCCVTVMIGG